MFDIIFNFSSDAVLLISETGLILRANPTALKIFGYSLEEITGSSLEMLLPAHLHSRHQALFSQFAAETSENSHQMKDFREVMAQHRDGHAFPINVAIGKATVDGSLTLIAILRDLTYQKETDSQLRLLATFTQENPNPTLRVQTDGKILFCNPAGNDLLAMAGQDSFETAPLNWMRQIKHAYKNNQQRESVFQYKDRIYSLVFNPVERLGYVNIFGLDITGRENSRMRLELSDDILSSIGNLVLVSNSQGLITYVSPSVTNILGYAPEEIMGNGWWEIERITGGQIDEEKKYVRRAASGETLVDEQQYEHQVRHKDGTWRTLMFSDAKGPRDLLIGIGADITLLKHSEAALKESEARYRLAISNADAVPYEVNFCLDQYAFIGEEIERITGFRREELTPDKFASLIEEPVIRERYGNKLTAASDLLGNGDANGVWRCDFRIQTQSGEYRWLSDTAVPVKDSDGKVTGSIGILQDVTARKLTEMQLKNERDLSMQVMNNMGQGLTIITETGHFEYVNPTLERMLGYEPGELIGKTTQDVIFPDDHAALKEMTNRIRQGEITTYESRLVPKDGREIFGLLTVVPRWIDGKFSGAITTVTDLSERYRIENELRQAYSEALSASKFKSTFLATMSHEIRTPMNAIIGMNEILLDTPLTEEQREFSGIIASSAQHLLTLINDILDLSRIEAGKLSLRFTRINLSRLISEVVQMLQSKAKEKGLELEANIDPALPEELIGDPERIRQILVNLTGNAIKFTETGVVVLSVTPSPADTVPDHEEDEIVNFAVADTGIGIPEEACKELFEPFKQVDSGVTRKYGGSGLGLAISRRLVELMHGEIGFDSVEGVGSTFWFVLPLARTASHPALTQKGLSGKNNISPKTLPSFGTQKPVLVVDDNEINTKLLVFQLGKFNMQAISAATSAEAVELLTTRPDDFCLTLMDVQMPVMDGLLTTGVIREKELAEGGKHHAVIVAVTANALSGDRETCLNAGMDDYLSKPVSLEMLSGILKKWVKE